MNKLVISIFGNKILIEILDELQLFKEFEFKFFDNLDLCIRESKNNNQLIIFFLNNENNKDFKAIIQNNLPVLVITKHESIKNKRYHSLSEKISMPFGVLEFKKKIVSILARYEFSQSSLINLGGYTIDKNERKIKKGEVELQLTEKEINFLILFSQKNTPLTRNFILKSVWNYSSESDTHTVETHIHRLRKKILEKFNDKNFIKNDNKGYYI
tara:strand:- start:1051 stop:1689 length:639 start_codon:yes stop_codon:yes gene_type:complete